MKSTANQVEKAMYIDERILLKFFFYPLARIVSKRLSTKIIRPTHITVTWYLIMFLGTYLGYTGNSTLVVFAVFVVAYFLDCLDGQYARDSGITSSTGKLLDDFGGDLFEALLWISLGHASQVSKDSYPFITDLGYCIAILVLLRGSLGLRLMKMEQQADPDKTAKGSIRDQKKDLRKWVESLLDFGNLQIPLIFGAILLDVELLLITLILVVCAIRLLVSVKLAFKKTDTWDEA